MAKAGPIEVTVNVTSNPPGGEHIILVAPDDKPILQGQQATSACGQEFTVTDVPTFTPTKPVCPLCVTRMQQERDVLMSAVADTQWRTSIAYKELVKIDKRWERG